MRGAQRFKFLCLLLVGTSALEVIQPTPDASHRNPAQLLSLSLDKIGSKSFSSAAEQLKNAAAEQLKDATSNAGSKLMPGFLSKELEVSTSPHMFTASAIFASFLLFWVFVILILLLAWAFQMGEDCSGDAVSELEASAVETTRSSHGSWARKLEDSAIEDRDALALLLRCNIVSQQEFRNSDVSQEHFDECLWIAKSMLQERPLQDWVELSQHGRQAFEDSVTAVFAKGRSQGQPINTLVGPPSNERSEQKTATAEEAPTPLLSGVSAASAVTFRPSDHDQFGKPALSKVLPEKSPVPLVNCHDEETASSAGSTHAEDHDDNLSELFPSLFGSDSWPSSAAPSQLSSSVSEQSSPDEAAKAPNSPLTDLSDRVALRLSAREIMVPASVDLQLAKPRRTVQLA